MRPDDLAKLVEDVADQVVGGATRFAVLGTDAEALELLASLREKGLLNPLPALYGDQELAAAGVDARPWSALAESEFDVLIVASDRDKELVLDLAMPHLAGAPRVLVAGYGHLDFRDAVLDEELGQLLVPSIANGYPNTITHLYQCLANAARLELDGAVVEFGTFKGGTSVLLARLIKRLGVSRPVLTFDTFDGFPGRRSALDMYDHPDCVFTDLPSLRAAVAPWDIELVVGDIVDTAAQLGGRPIVLTFIDTDNFSSASAAVTAVVDSTVVGGAIVFDHFTGVNRFRYTLGERMAGRPLLQDERYFNLHGTGVFIRQR
jgi:O-methyltransferase